MLVLKRKVDERIRIGDDVVIMVVWIGERNVKLGITAPKEMLILRDDVVDKRLETNTKAATSMTCRLNSCSGRGDGVTA